PDGIEVTRCNGMNVLLLTHSLFAESLGQAICPFLNGILSLILAQTFSFFITIFKKLFRKRKFC
ncbi:MAG: hypothetical protein IJE63_03355, partial [Clostridia bacterium]|nr:hypothetical protein [Clostridia bacterium]